MSQELTPGMQLGRVTLKHKRGQGGMAQVWVGHHSGFQCDVAVKVLNANLALHERMVRMFMREARAMVAIHHRNIVAVYDAGEEGPYLVMEFVDGESADERLERTGGALPNHEALRIVAEVLEGLHAAHERGIIHRDIKPANILLSEDDRVRIADFGIAHIRPPDGALASPGTIVGAGTKGYMAPEQRDADREPDARMDIYGVGATLFTLVTDREPVDLDHAEDEPEKLAGIHPAVARVIRVATRYRPERRYRDAREMRDAVVAARESLLHEERPGWRFTLPRLSRRAAVLGIACAAATALVVAGVRWYPPPQAEAIVAVPAPAPEHEAEAVVERPAVDASPAPTVQVVTPTPPPKALTPARTDVKQQRKEEPPKATEPLIASVARPKHAGDTAAVIVTVHDAAITEVTLLHRHKGDAAWESTVLRCAQGSCKGSFLVPEAGVEYFIDARTASGASHKLGSRSAPSFVAPKQP